MREIVYQGRDNAIDLVLLADGEPVALDVITRVVLEVGETTLDSDALGLGVGQPFDPTKSVTYEGASVDALTLRLGGQGLTPGDHDNCRLIVYDPDHPSGLVWTDALALEVRE